MQQEHREFFRFDVFLPVYLEPLTDSNSCLHVTKQQLVSDHDYQEIGQENILLNQLFQDDVHIKNGGVELFGELQHKLEFMIWLLDCIVDGHDPRETEAFRQRVLAHNALTMPEGKGSSQVVPLLQALYQRMDELIAELLEVVDKSVQGKVFMYHKVSPALFSAQSYMPNLAILAQQGNWLAQVIELLVAKLNHYERLFKKLKAAYQSLSDSQAWPIEKVNLGAGGFALHSKIPFQVGDKVCALLAMDSQFVFAKSECVYTEDKNVSDDLGRVAFKFLSITSEDTAHIVRFLTSEELSHRPTE